MDTRDNAPLIAAGGGLLLFISLFFDWFGDGTGWQWFDLTDIVLAGIALFGIAVGGSIATGNAFNVPDGSLATASLIGLGMLATLIFEGDERQFGVFLALVGVLGILFGALQLSRRSRPARTREVAPPPPPTSGA